MVTLYLNSCTDLEMGLWDGGRWLCFNQYKIKNSSEWFHDELHQKLSDHGLKIQHCKEVVWCAGPGSYTGLRMVTGFVETLSWLGVSHYAFLAQEVGLVVGEREGTFVSFAFKGEYFYFQWDGANNHQGFIANPKELSLKVGESLNKTINFWGIAPIDGLQVKEVGPSIKQEFSKIYQWVTEHKIHRPIFYYRPPEKEFKIS